MALTKQGDFTFNHADQVDRPAYTAAENKAKFDSRANELKATLNGLIDDLQATTDGASGADNIGMTAITETGAAVTVQAVVEALIARLKATDDSASGADLIGATTVGSLSGATVQAILEEMDTAIGSAATASALAAHLADTVYQTAGGTGTAITLTISGTLVDGYPITFIAGANNSGAATTINTKSLYKPNTTDAPTLVAGKAYTVWYDETGDCFFIKASAEGTAVAGDVLAGTTFSNDNDTGLAGSMVNRGSVTFSPGDTVNVGYYSGGSVSGVKFASGSASSSGSTLTVNGLTFTPRVIMAYCASSGVQYMLFYDAINYSTAQFQLKDTAANDFHAANVSNYSGYVSSTGFKLEAVPNGTVYRWYAWS